MSDEQTVFIVDDDQAARESLAALVRAQGLRAATFASAAEFLAALDSSPSGCLVVDVRMKGMSGLQLQRYLLDRGIPLPVIVITGFADVPTAVSAMGCGAITFLQKPCAESELLKAIHEALAQDRARRQQEQEREAMRQRFASLTEGEMAVLKMLIAGKLNKQIKQKLDIGMRTVELRRSQIMQKLGASSLAQLVQMALIAGITPEETD